MKPQQVTHFHLFGGSGSGAAGFKDADPSIGAMKGEMVLLGGIDVDARACRDFKMLTGVAQACVDLFSLDQYLAWHGHMPPEGWREATADTVRAAAQGQFPDIVFLSAPCKGFSGLLPAAHAATSKYFALNELTLRGVWLMLEAFEDDLPGLIVFENVPRIATRGRHLLDQIVSMLRHYGYATAETTHDCGTLGDGLGQSRRRFLLVARLVRKVPPFLYEPPKRALRSVGEVLGHIPLPGDPVGGPMTGLPDFNYPAFHAEAQRLRSAGWHVENPAEGARPLCGTWAGFMRLGLTRMLTCDSIVLLPGWARSKGASIEHFVAVHVGLAVVYHEPPPVLSLNLSGF